jgi:hypothetical protein
MVHLSKKNMIQLLAGLIPVILSIIFAINQSWIWLLLCVISLYLVVGILPLFKKQESLYMFIFIAIAGFPINARISYWLVSEDFIGSNFLVGDILWVILLCCMFFSVEEILLGVIARIIWHKQYIIRV